MASSSVFMTFSSFAFFFPNWPSTFPLLFEDSNHGPVFSLSRLFVVRLSPINFPFSCAAVILYGNILSLSAREIT